MSLVTGNDGRRFIGIAVVLGLAAAIVGYYSLTGLAARAAAGSDAQFRDVVVTSGDLTYGVKLEAPMLKTVRYPRESVPAGAYASIDSVLGQTTKVFMSAREPVTATKLSSRGGGLSMLVRPSMRAASLEVNQVSGVSGFVLPGDRVDVLITVSPPGYDQNAVTRTLLQNVEVLAAGQKTQQQDNKPLSVQSVTLLVDPSGAEMLAHATHQGEIALVLRNPDDNAKTEVSTFSTRQMMGYGDVPATPTHHVRSSVVTPPTTTVIEKDRDPGKIRIIRQADVTETPALKDTLH
jgi:pilus assembly protein CpaB